MRRRLLATLLTGAALASGCGGSSPSETQLRAQAGRICSAMDRRLGRIGLPGLGPADRAFLARGATVLAPGLRELKALQPQGEAGPVYSSALDALGDEVTELRRTIAALDRHQDPALAFASLQRRLSPLEAQAAAAWRALEIPACVNR